MKIVFLGTPQIAATCLEEIIKSKHEVLAVVTKQDKPVGRGNKVQTPPVKQVALKHNLPVYQFGSIRTEGVEILKKLKPDALVLVAFGQILSQEILDIALPLNLHGSILPALRGPSPIQSAILNGFTQTGYSIMKMGAEVDNGDVMLQGKVDILPSDNAGTLFEKIAEKGSKDLVKALDLIEEGKAVFTSQNHEKATYTYRLTKENAGLDFNLSTKKLINKIRAYNPAPVAYMQYNGEKYKVFEASIYDGPVTLKLCEVGEVVIASPKVGLVIKTADGYLLINKLQAPNGKILDAKAFVNGGKIPQGSIIESVR